MEQMLKLSKIISDPLEILVSYQALIWSDACCTPCSLFRACLGTPLDDKSGTQPSLGDNSDQNL